MSTETYEIKNFEYMQNKTISITLPTWLNSGYYLIEGYGFIKYSTSGKEWDESTDVNVPNTPTYESSDNSENEKKQSLGSDDIQEEKIVINEDGDYKVSVSYETKEIKKGNYKVADPKARIIGDDGATFLSQEEAGKLETTIKLVKGEYKLQVIGLSGRTYSYNVEKAK